MNNNVNSIPRKYELKSQQVGLILPGHRLLEQTGKISFSRDNFSQPSGQLTMGKIEAEFPQVLALKRRRGWDDRGIDPTPSKRRRKSTETIIKYSR
jgi:hypothetical protein